MSNSYGLADGDWYQASDGQWYCWPDPTPHASRPVEPPAAALLPPMPAAVPSSGGWDPPAPIDEMAGTSAFAPAFAGAPAAPAAPAYGAPDAPSAWPAPAAPSAPGGWGPPGMPGQPAGGWAPGYAPLPAQVKWYDTGKAKALIGGGLIAFFLLVGWISSLDNAKRDSSGNVTAEGESGITVLRAGDCLSSLGTGEVDSVDVTPCDRPHAGQIFAVFDMPDTDYPGEDNVANKAEEQCAKLIGAFLGGQSQGGGGYGLSMLLPLRSSWKLDGGRAVKCILTAPGGVLMTGSAQGKGPYQG